MSRNERSSMTARAQLFLVLQESMSDLYARKDMRCYDLASSLLLYPGMCSDRGHMDAYLSINLPLLHRARVLMVLSTDRRNPFSAVEQAGEAVRLLDVVIRQDYSNQNLSSFPARQLERARVFLARAEEFLEEYKADPWSLDSDDEGIDAEEEEAFQEDQQGGTDSESMASVGTVADSHSVAQEGSTEGEVTNASSATADEDETGSAGVTDSDQSVTGVLEGTNTAGERSLEVKERAQRLDEDVVDQTAQSLRAMQLGGSQPESKPDGSDDEVLHIN